ncbi:tellurite resistance TerB family protein [Undibacter mobilis]|uniref:Tellurite resistance TerB family protein n=1 Tax=Undibacter mobilis TaxID=2292256 RepID=A0A371B9K0_9BRAD|nr:tellurite resistance TerB family protein [Undibacter mobilis]RDV04258.1 tellurite resistance TerB family protein [Undibacter mobilis]
MFDAKSLLDQFMGGQNQGGPNQQGFGGGRGPFGQSGGGDLLQQAGNMLGGFGGGALTGGLAGLLLGSKGGRKLAGNALTYGGMAVAGALAYRAYQNYKAGKQASPTAAAETPLLPPPANTPFNPVQEADQQSLARNLLRAMIAAAKADGHIDAAEQANIFAQMDKMNVGAEDKVFVMDELRAPLDVDAVARCARTPEEAAELYTVSLLAIDVDNPSERAYLALLAARLRLDDKLVAHLHATVEGAMEPVKQTVA